MYNARAYRTLKTLFGKIQSESDVKIFKRLEIAEELAYKRQGDDQTFNPILLDIVETTRTSHNIKVLVEKLKFKQRNIILNSLIKIDDHLLSERWADAATNARKVLESCLLGVADKITTERLEHKSIMIHSKKPFEIRNFLKESQLITKSEHTLINSTYSFLSEVGAHPHNTTSDQASLAVTSGLSLAEFVLQKLNKATKAESND
ncbi:hypothetical protein BFL40_24530 [Pseudomonas costantinii]|nr:hypothetical protein BFL40_24530 [Pseudomonas costantinii]